MELGIEAMRYSNENKETNFTFSCCFFPNHLRHLEVNFAALRTPFSILLHKLTTPPSKILRACVNLYNSTLPGRVVVRGLNSFKAHPFPFH